MNMPDVSPGEMRKLTNICDGDLEAMQAGLIPDDDPHHGAIARFVQDLDGAFPEPSTVRLQDGHILAMMEASHLMAENGEPAVRSASKAHGPENQASGLPMPRRLTMLQRVFATKAAKVAVGAAALALAFSGVAVAGVLPTRVQNAIADAAQTVGVNLPGGVDEIEAPAAELPVVETPDASSDTSDTVDMDDQQSDNVTPPADNNDDVSDGATNDDHSDATDNANDDHSDATDGQADEQDSDTEAIPEVSNDEQPDSHDDEVESVPSQFEND